ncbi:crotonase/enoyl-CoA hydratase family protein [Paraburkholderia unamae]|uniref:Enoyl-CoA hydratase/carnithine racemase n=1 Tax=Paraburkholderia unamae TaxID=219649 RepID=A0ABX5KG57_9BURK|nr:crotonase/enoyl-CoA hydratase family protein [Paraburkholderia unamae]PVX75166.1 enoyl-CoA hydratase/carnithine racemase [Paraburkholderia unamae]RAR57543.1 enoyl-CoA hydratase/carnithine racemase [Paraburkholderia unamae]CAG9257512.1 Enoyl-CoA hydratase [Paraburkholderia unamae]
MSNFLSYTQENHVVTLTMLDAERRNPLTGNSVVDEFLSAITRIQNDTSVRAVIITGADPAFSTGGDIKTMQKQADPEVNVATIREDYRTGIQRLPLALFNLDVPVIAAVNGPAIGAGLDLACMCDIRIASEKAKFAESFVKLGIIPGDGGAWLLPRVIGLARASEMTFTAEIIDAQRALEYGLVSRVVAHDQLMSAARELAERIAVHPPYAMRMTKKLIREGIHGRLDSVLELSAVFQAVAHKTDEHREAVSAFLEKRPPNFNK